jgi:hypothetical protein
VPRLITTACALLLLLPFAACTKKPPQKSDPDIAVWQLVDKTVSEIRQIEGVRAFTLFHEKDQTSPLCVGEFRRIDARQLNAEKFDELFPFYITFDRHGGSMGFGRLKMLWCPVPLPKPWGSFNIKTNDSGPRVMTSVFFYLPDAFRSPRFTAIFPASQIDYHSREWGVPKDQKVFAFYEIPPAWSPGAIAILSGKESPDEPIEQASPLGTVFCFLHALRAAEADPSLAAVPRQQLTNLINRKADPQLIETLFYLAIHPATQNPYAEDYWKMFMTAVKTGSIPTISAINLVSIFRIFAGGLPDEKSKEFHGFLEQSSLKPGSPEFWDSMSDEDRCFQIAQYNLGLMVDPAFRPRTPWPKPSPATTDAP